MTQPTLLPAIDELRLIAEDTKITPGRVVHVQTGEMLTHQRRIRVIDDFDSNYQTTVAESVCTQSCASAVTLALQVKFGAERVIDRGEKFNEQKATVKYQLPQSYEARHNASIISEDATPKRER